MSGLLVYDNNFSRWTPWRLRNELEGLERPGVYAVALSHRDLSNRSFSWRPEIVYVGMTNAVSGLRGRLKQFDNTILGKTGHGGAERFRYKFPHYKPLVKSLYVAVAPFKCDVTSNRPKDLRKMGRVVMFEYVCLAEYVETCGALPEFNNKKESPKHSLTLGGRKKIRSP